MKTIMLLAFIFIAGFSQAQTKRIAHYSHSGKANNFDLADKLSKKFGGWSDHLELMDLD
jgi:hypothetical protein